MLHECLKCHEEIYHFFSSEQQELLLALIKEILDKEGKSEAFEIALRQLNYYMKFFGREVPFCRYCLVEIFEEIGGVKLEEIKKAYAFDEVK